jgi:hypothetical protein
VATGAAQPPAAVTPPALDRLVQAVQTNAHIADARHAADMTLCVYLLQMREFHRWERRLPFGAPLSRGEVGTWIAEREALWEQVETQDYMPLPIDGADFGPFDTGAVNEHLRPHGLLYGAGLVDAGRPVFFLAERHAESRREGLPVQLAGRELARGLLAPVAALAANAQPPCIVVRRESLARWCWEKFEVFSLKHPAGSPFHAVVQAYGLDRDFAAALPRWLDEQGEAAVLHEIGEYRAGQRLGPAWGAMRQGLPTRRGELHARALRDHLADFEVTLPTLLARDARASIHVWFAGLDGVRELLFPSLKDAYTAWLSGDGGQALQRAIARGHAHFSRVAGLASALHRQDGAQAGAAIEALLTAPETVCTDLPD